MSIGNFSSRSFTVSVPLTISAVVWNGKGIRVKHQGISNRVPYLKLGGL